jgi:carboxyl-terminal processing protease
VTKLDFGQNDANINNTGNASSNANDNANKVSSLNKNLWIVIGTSILTFVLTSIAFVGIRIFQPQYDIKFPKIGVSAESINKFNEAREIIKNKYYTEVADDKLLEGATAGMADALQDPYTVYYSKEQMKSFDEKSEGSYCGIGITVKPDTNHILNVVDTFKNSPAKKAGIISGDKIIKVDDNDVTSIKDEDIVINMIKGAENTIVKVTVFRPSDEGNYDFSVERKIIKVENIQSEILSNNMGYIKISLFDREISKDFGTHLKSLISRNIKGLIIDVRDNPGGNYKEVVRLCDMLLPKALIVYTQDRYGNRSEEISDEAEINIPIVVLVNGNSASASEILAGALKDNKKAILVGTKTYGKGLVQTIHRFGDDSGLKYTISRYFTPSGAIIDKIGIEPDIKVEFDDKLENKAISQIDKVQDIQLQKAVEILKLQISK